MFNKSAFNLRTAKKLINLNMVKYQKFSFSDHGNKKSDDHGHDDHGHDDHGHDDHGHGHHEITGKVDLHRSYIPLSREVRIITLILYILF